MPVQIRDSLKDRANLHLTESSSVDLKSMMSILRQEYAVRQLICEGGGQVFRSLLAEDLVDEIYLTLCPRVFGGELAPTLTGVAGEHLPRSIRCNLKNMEVNNGECFLQYAVHRELEDVKTSFA